MCYYKMSIYEKYYDRLEDLVQTSLSLYPNNKKAVLNFDNLKGHSGYIQWYIAKNIKNIHVDKEERKSCILLPEDAVVEDFNYLTTEEKNKYKLQLHDEGQELIGNIIKDTYPIIKQNPDKYQAQLAEIIGFDKQKLGDNNWIAFTIFNIMCEQGAIIKIDKYGDEKVGRDHSYFRCVGDIIYDPIPFVEGNRSHSKLEAECAALSKDYGFNFRQQVTFKECKHKKCLPFDFEIIFDDGQTLLVEVDGAQHYYYIPYFHESEEDFKLQQKRDRIKNKYVEEYDRNFLRIRYDEDMKMVLDNKLREMGIID